MIGWVSSSRAYATDRFIFGRQTDGSGLRLDRQQDWRVVGGEERRNESTGDTWTTLHFWRHLDTRDCNDRPIVAGQLSQVIWSYGKRPLTSMTAQG